MVLAVGTLRRSHPRVHRGGGALFRLRGTCTASIRPRSALAARADPGFVLRAATAGPAWGAGTGDGWAGPRHPAASREVHQKVGTRRSLWGDRGSAPRSRPPRLAGPVVALGCCTASAGRPGASGAAERHAAHRRLGARDAAHSDAGGRQDPQRAAVCPAGRARHAAGAGRARHGVLDPDRLRGRSRPGQRHI